MKELKGCELSGLMGDERGTDREREIHLLYRTLRHRMQQILIFTCVSEGIWNQMGELLYMCLISLHTGFITMGGSWVSALSAAAPLSVNPVAPLHNHCNILHISPLSLSPSRSSEEPYNHPLLATGCGTL